MKLKSILFALLSLLLALVLAAYALLTVFQPQLTQAILTRVNQVLPGEIRAEKIELSLFEQFPYVSLAAHQVALTHKTSEDTGHIYQVEKLYVGFDFWKIVRGQYTIKKILLRNGAFRLVRDEEGNINLLTAKMQKEQDVQPDDPEESAAPLRLELEQVLLENIDFIKDDRLNDQFADLFIRRATLDFLMKGNFYDVHTEADLFIKDFRLGERRFFEGRNLHFSLDTEVDLDAGKILLLPSTVSIHTGELEIEGSIDLNGDKPVDIRLTGKKDNFEFLVSLASEELYQRFRNYEKQGRIFFQGKIFGYTGNGHTPQIELEFGCENAHFVNPNAKSLRDLNFRGFFTNGAERCMSTAELFIENLSGRPERSMFFGQFHMVNFVEPRLFIDLHSDLDLADLAVFLGNDELAEASGNLRIDLTLDQLDEKVKTEADKLAKMKAGADSRLVFRNLKFRLKGMPYALGGLNGRVDLKGGRVTIDSLSGLLGKTDLKISGSVSNILPLLISKPDSQWVEVKLKARSERLDIQELLSFDSAFASIDEAISGMLLDISFKAPAAKLARFELVPEGELLVNKFSAALRHYPLPFRDFSGRLKVGKSDIEIGNLKGYIGELPLSLDAKVKNWVGLLPDTSRAPGKEPVEMQLNLKAPSLPLDQLFTYKDSSYWPASMPFTKLTDLSGSLRVTSTPAQLLRTDGYQPAARLWAEQVSFRAEGLPAVKKLSMALQTDSLHMNVEKFSATVGRSDLDMSAKLLYFWDSLPENNRYTLRLRSDLLDMNELTAAKNKAKPTGPAGKNTANPEPEEQPANPFAEKLPQAELQLETGKLYFGDRTFEKLTVAMRVQPNQRVDIDDFQMNYAGGRVGLKGYFNGADPENIYFNSELKLKGLDINKAFYKFDNFGQEFLIDQNISGTLDATIRSNVLVFPDLTADLKRSTATVEATVREGVLREFAPFRAMARFTGDRDLDNVRFSEISNTFEVRNGTLHIPRMSINTTLGYFLIEGTKTIEQVMDFEVEVPVRLVRKAAWNFIFNRRGNRGGNNDGQEEEVMTAESLNNRRYLRFTVQGTPDNFDVRLGRRRN